MSTKYQYALGWEISLSDEEKFRDFVDTQGINLVDYKNILKAEEDFDFSYLELKYINNYLVQIKDIGIFQTIVKPLTERAKTFQYFNNRTNEISFLTQSRQKTNSYLGGKVPVDFICPMPDFLEVPFQLIGKLSKKDKPFHWLPFDDLYLTYPLYTSIGEFLFLDYTNPMNPKVLGKDYRIDYPYGKVGRTDISNSRFNRNTI